VFVHWLVGLFWVEVGVAIMAVDRTVGLRAYALADTRRGRNHPWPPSKNWIGWVAGAALIGLAIAYAGIAAEEPLAVLAALMVVLGGHLVWAIPELKRRQHDEHG
jgi:hypothetical protein